MMTTDVYPGKDLGTLDLVVTDEMVQHYIKGLTCCVGAAATAITRTSCLWEREGEGGSAAQGRP